MDNRLREMRSARGWSQAELAHHLDVSRQTVNALENGRYDPSLRLAFRLSVVFDEPIEALFQPEVATSVKRPAVERHGLTDVETG